MTEAKKLVMSFRQVDNQHQKTWSSLSQGFKSVVNLRSLDEAGALVDEQQQSEAAGLQYVNVPLQQQMLNWRQRFFRVELPTPVYFHCGVGGRASAAALIAFATQQKLSQGSHFGESSGTGY